MPLFSTDTISVYLKIRALQPHVIFRREIVGSYCYMTNFVSILNTTYWAQCLLQNTKYLDKMRLQRAIFILASLSIPRSISEMLLSSLGTSLVPENSLSPLLTKLLDFGTDSCDSTESKSIFPEVSYSSTCGQKNEIPRLSWNGKVRRSQGHSLRSQLRICRRSTRNRIVCTFNHGCIFSRCSEDYLIM